MFDIVSLAISKEVGTWEVDLKNSVGFGSNFTLSWHTLFPVAAVRPRYGNTNNMCARWFKWLFYLSCQAWETFVNKPRGYSLVSVESCHLWMTKNYWKGCDIKKTTNCYWVWVFVSFKEQATFLKPSKSSYFDMSWRKKNRLSTPSAITVFSSLGAGFCLC